MFKFAAIVLATSALVGCGYSEAEMRAQLRGAESLKAQLAAEEQQNAKFQREVDEARANLDKLKGQLSDANIDVVTLQKNVEEQATALEEFRRRAAQLEAIRLRFDELRKKLQGLTKLGLTVAVRNNRMTIALPGDVLFDSGRETLKKNGEEILAEVAAVIRRDADLSMRDFQVAGHTDDRAYKAGIFKDNWGLSAMRAREVLVFLVGAAEKGGGGLNANHWSAAGYGATDPVATNDADEGRQTNRRCELVVLPKLEEMIDLRSLTISD
ncbi:MAG: hypothetical protein EXR75_07465 [Myxococcales bacterium]|nr:hypothetical protein [Myxococcales bacterium]